MSDERGKRLRGMWDGEAGRSPLWSGNSTDPDYLAGYQAGLARKQAKDQEATNKTLREMQEAQEQEHRRQRAEERERQREAEEHADRLRSVQRVTAEYTDPDAGHDAAQIANRRQLNVYTAQTETFHRKLTEARQHLGISRDYDLERIQEVTRYRRDQSRARDAELTQALEASGIADTAGAAVAASIKAMKAAGICELLVYFIHDHPVSSAILQGHESFFLDGGRFVGTNAISVTKLPVAPRRLAQFETDLRKSEEQLRTWRVTPPKQITNALSRLEQIAEASTEWTATDPVDLTMESQLDRMQPDGIPEAIGSRSFLRRLESGGQSGFLSSAIAMAEVFQRLASDVRTAAAFRANPLADGSLAYPHWPLLRDLTFDDVKVPAAPQWIPELARHADALRKIVDSMGRRADRARAIQLCRSIDALFKANTSLRPPLAAWPGYVASVRRANAARRLALATFWGALTLMALNWMAINAELHYALYGASFRLFLVALVALILTAGFRKRQRSVVGAMIACLDHISSMAEIAWKRAGEDHDTK